MACGTETKENALYQLLHEWGANPHLANTQTFEGEIKEVDNLSFTAIFFDPESDSLLQLQLEKSELERWQREYLIKGQKVYYILGDNGWALEFKKNQVTKPTWDEILDSLNKFKSEELVNK